MSASRSEYEGGPQAELASQFAAEIARRQHKVGDGASEEGSSNRGRADENTSGIREIVLDDNGEPTSIPRRPAPPPSSSNANELSELIRSPSFFFGFLLSVGSLILLLAIAGADSAASA